MVPESTEVSTLYPLAQLQVDDTEDSHSLTVSGSTGSLLLRHAGIHRQENIQCLIHVCRVLLWKNWNWPRGYKTWPRGYKCWPQGYKTFFHAQLN